MATLTFKELRKIHTSIQDIAIPVYEIDVEVSFSGNYLRTTVNLPVGFSFSGSTPVYSIKENGIPTIHHMLGYVSNPIATIDSSDNVGARIDRNITTGTSTSYEYRINNNIYSFILSRWGGYTYSTTDSYNAMPLFVITPTNKIYLVQTDYLINDSRGSITCEGLTQTKFGFYIYTFNETQSGFAITAFGNSLANIELVSTDIYNRGETWITDNDPYADVGDSTTGGGDGTFDGSSDPVPVPNLPTVGAQDSGFITLFTPTASQMKDLAHYMWVNPLFDIESGFKKLFADPMDCILGLSVVPVTIPTSGAKSVNIGNLVTSVTMNVASQQYIEVDCGTVTMDRFFGSYLDFEPYTKISIFLPYCGTHSLSMDDIAGKTIGVVYHIDILTGSCIAFVKCGDSVLYEFNGACGSNIPVNSLNFASTIENAIRIAVNIGTTVATAGASAPLTGANAAARETARKIGTGVSLAGSTAEGALSLKPNVSRSGALGGGVGILGHQIPYFIITRPRLCKPAKQDFFQGYPSFIQTTIGDLIGKGFTSFTNVIISGQYLTDEEETELESILESGVYL